MPGSTRQRSEQVQETAMQVVARIGVLSIDAMDADPRHSLYVALYKQLQATESVAYDTARRHIAKACRRQRHPDWQPTPDGWGGRRK